MTTKRKAPKAAPKAKASKADAERLEAQKRRLLSAQFGYIEQRLDRAAMVMNALLFTMQEHKEAADANGACTCDLSEYIANVDLAVEYIEKTAEMAFFRSENALKPEERAG